MLLCNTKTIDTPILRRMGLGSSPMYKQPLRWNDTLTNFTFTLTRKRTKSYYVTKLEHTVLITTQMIKIRRTL